MLTVFGVSSSSPFPSGASPRNMLTLRYDGPPFMRTATVFFEVTDMMSASSSVVASITCSSSSSLNPALIKWCLEPSSFSYGASPRNMLASRYDGPPFMRTATVFFEVTDMMSASSSVVASITCSSSSPSSLNPALIKRFLRRSSFVLGRGVGRKISSFSSPSVSLAVVEPLRTRCSVVVLVVLRKESNLE